MEHSGHDAGTCVSDLRVLRKEIEDQIAIQLRRVGDTDELRLCDLKTRLNSTSPVCSFPSEILTEVFLRAARSHERDAITHLKTLPPYSWIRWVTHVCRHWRNVALNCQPLWSNLTLTGCRDFMALLLERTKDMPLSIRMVLTNESPSRSSRSWREEAAKLLLSHLPRTRTLSLTVVERYLGDAFEYIATVPAPLLESLYIFQDATAYSSSPFPHHLRLAEQFLGRRETQESLRRLTIYHFPLDWPMLRLPNMTHLAVKCLSRAQRLLLPPRDFLQALVHMPLLEELIMARTLLAPRNEVEEASLAAQLPGVVLTHLRLVRMEESLLPCAFLLDHMDMPSLATLSLVLLNDQLNQHPEVVPDRFFDVLVRKSASLGRIRTLAMTSPLHGPEIRVCAYDEYHEPPTQDIHVTDLLPDSIFAPCVDISLEWSAQDFAVLCQLPPFDDVRSVFVAAPLSTRMWLAVGRHTSNVTHLRYQPPVHRGIPLHDALLQHPWASRVKGAGGGELHAKEQYIFPRLRILTLEEPDFTLGFEDVARLLGSFVQRRKAGAEIETLQVVHPINMRPVHLDYLKEVVSNVKCELV